MPPGLTRLSIRISSMMKPLLQPVQECSNSASAVLAITVISNANTRTKNIDKCFFTPCIIIYLQNEIYRIICKWR